MGTASGAVGYIKDAAGVVAANSQHPGARTIDGDVVRDVQFSASKRDGAGDGEVDAIPTHRGVNRIAQRSSAAIGGAGHGAIGGQKRSCQKPQQRGATNRAT